MKVISGRGSRILLLAAGFFLALLAAESKAAGAPRIQVDQPRWDFGVVTNLVELNHDFVIRNAGDAPLEIRQVLSSCEACLRAGVGSTNIPPGGSTVVHSRLDLRLLRGPVSRSIAIDSNDQENPMVTVELAGTVVLLYKTTPSEIYFDVTRSRSVSAEISPLLKLHAPLSGIEGHNTNFLVSLTPRESGAYLLKLEALESLPVGNASLLLTLRSPDTNDPPCLTVVFIYNPPAVEMIPARLEFRPQDESQMRILWLKQHGTNRLTLLDVIPPSDKFRCEIEREANGFDYRIYVTAWEQEKFFGTTNVLTLKMADAWSREKTVPVPLYIEARRRAE